jgi:hypothetical protein
MVTPITFAEDIELEYSVDLRTIMDSLMATVGWNPVVPITDELTVFVRPMTYKQMSESAIKTFETQKIMQIANDTEMSEDDKVRAFKESFTKLTDVTIGIVEQSIFRVDSSNGSTENPTYIREFIENADKEIFNAVQLHLDSLRTQNAIKPIEVAVTDEMREKGMTGDTIEVPLVFDPATFFA